MTVLVLCSMAGVTTGHVNYLANAIHEVTKFGQEALILFAYALIDAQFLCY